MSECCFYSTQVSLATHSFRAEPSNQLCVGDAVNLSCHAIPHRIDGLRQRIQLSRGQVLVQVNNTPRHMLLSGSDVLNLIITNVTLADNDVEYTCTTSHGRSSAMNLSVTGM